MSCKKLWNTSSFPKSIESKIVNIPSVPSFWLCNIWTVSHICFRFFLFCFEIKYQIRLESPVFLFFFFPSSSVTTVLNLVLCVALCFKLCIMTSSHAFFTQLFFFFLRFILWFLWLYVVCHCVVSTVWTHHHVLIFLLIAVSNNAFLYCFK